MDRKIDEHFGFEAADNVEGVLARIAADAEHDIVGWPTGPAHGRDGARPFYEALFAGLADGHVDCIRRLYGADSLVGDQQRLAAYDDFFSRDGLVVVPLSDGVIALATDVRARSRLRTPDALQAACCLSLPDSARFVTGDTGFRREPALDLLLV